MKSRMLCATAAVLFGLSFAAEAVACGDKFLVVGRGARFQRGYVSIHPASVLLVDTKQSVGNDVLLPLRRAGHRVDVISDSNQLQRAMAGNKYEVVLADWGSASEIQSLVSSAAASALFVPMLNGASKADIEAATKLYGCPLESSKAKVNRSFLARLDDVIDAKRKSKPVTCELK